MLLHSTEAKLIFLGNRKQEYLPYTLFPAKRRDKEHITIAFKDKIQAYPKCFPQVWRPRLMKSPDPA